jgi:uncharacterized protein
VLQFCKYKWFFAWDEGKNRINRRKHGFSFESAARIFEDPNVISYVDRLVDGEERCHAIGGAGGIALLLVVHAVEEENDEEKIRIISARKANPRERALYESPHCAPAAGTEAGSGTAGLPNRLFRRS